MEKVAGNNLLLLLSGGVDSACCLAYLQSTGRSVDTLFVDYGQASAQAEHASARGVALHYGSDFRVLSICHERTLGRGEIIGRNAALVFAAVLSAELIPSSICLGIHAGTPYYDCSEAFCSDLDRIVSELTSGRTGLLIPFATWHKADIAEFATDHDVPVQLTYSCESSNTPCGECTSCKDRELFSC